MAHRTPGPLFGLRVVELASEHAAFAGKMLGDLGADVIVVEPPGGHPSRAYGPFVDDVRGPGAQPLVVALQHVEARRRARPRLRHAAPSTSAASPTRPTSCSRASRPTRSPRRHLDHPDLRADHEELIWVSVTPFGRTGTRAHEPATDLTLLAGGGPVWSCGYDDHSLPPVRGGGNQAFHIASTFAVMAALTAVLARDVTGRGQHVDVSMHAAANVTTEAGSYEWLVARGTVQRQTGRHALTTMSMPTQMLLRRRPLRHHRLPAPAPSATTRRWSIGSVTLGLRDEFPDIVLLDLGVERGGVTIAEMATDAAGGRDLRRRPRGADVHRRAHHRRRVLPRRPDPRARVRRGRGAGGGVRLGALRGARLPGRGRARRPRAHRTATRARRSSCRRRRGASPAARRTSASTTPRSSEP